MWLGEENRRLGISLKLLADRVLVRSRSRYFEEIILAESKEFGKFLVLKEAGDYTLQVAEKWDFYSEMLVHVPMCSHPTPKKVLIIGGGDGSTLKEVLKHQVKEVVLVDIDKEVVKVGKEYLAKEAFVDPRVRVQISDASEFLKETDEKFDVIIGDYSDPYSELPAGTLVSDEFYEGLFRALADDGIAALQAGTPVLQKEILKRIYFGAKKRFEKVAVYCSPVALYPGGIWCYVIASKGPNFSPKRDFEGIFYNKEVHEASFKLPTFVRKLIE